MGTLTAEVDIHFKNGTRTLQMVQKNYRDIEECEEGRVVCLNLKNGETHTGIFKGMSDDDILLGSLDRNVTLGYELGWVKDYFEELSCTPPDDWDKTKRYESPSGELYADYINGQWVVGIK